MKEFFLIILMSLAMTGHSQTSLIHLTIELDSSQYKFYFHPSEDNAQPFNGYQEFFENLMNLVLSDTTYYPSNMMDTEIIFTVLANGSLESFEGVENKNDSIFIEKIQSLGSWKPNKSGDQYISLRIISSGLEIFTIVEQSAEFPGGIKNFYEYLMQELKYPETAWKMGIQGRVFVQFIVEKDGSLSDIHVVKGIGAGCDEEAVRVLTNSPNWNPGRQRGKPIRQKMIQNILFKIDDPTIEKKKRKN
jgi:TonB family protein